MKINILHIVVLALAAVAVSSCSVDHEQPSPTKGLQPMTFRVTYPYESRATDSSFEEGDSIGLFVADDSLPLEPSGNLVNNAALTLSRGTWAAASTLYWSDGTFNAYAYYPYISSIGSTEMLPFSVSTDQSRPLPQPEGIFPSPKASPQKGGWRKGRAAPEREGGKPLSGYEASDLLYASAKGLKASAEPIDLSFRHIMSRVRVRIVKGEDYKGELPANAKVYIHNTVTSATVDLAAGVVTRDPKGKIATIRARQEDDHTFAAIIVPQRIESRQPLVEVEMNGVSYMYEGKFAFKPGMQHRINIIVSDNPDQVKIDIGGETVPF